MKAFCVGIVCVAGIFGSAGERDGWLDTALSHDYEWESAALPGSDRRDDYAADILFQESQANSLRGHVLRSIASVTGPVDAEYVAQEARSIVDAVQSINPSSDIIMPAVLLRADMGGEWLQAIRFEHEDISADYEPYILCAISLEVMRREYEYVEKHHPNDVESGVMPGESERLFAVPQPSFNLPIMAFFHDDRIKKDLLNSLVAHREREDIDRRKLKEIARELNVNAPVSEWAKPVLE